jgi:hypothetical protein
MKIIPSERIKCGGKYHRAGEPCDLPNEIGKALIEAGKAKAIAGRPTGKAGKAGKDENDGEGGGEGTAGGAE